MPSSTRPVEERTLYSNVLVPTDGSEGARRGMEHALDVAEKYGATVHVLHVVDERSVSATPALGSDELAIEKIEEEAELLLSEIAGAADDAGLESVCSCERGVPHERILAYAEENGIDLIVMGIHGRARTTRPHVGSTTDRVMRTSSVPVLPV